MTAQLAPKDVFLESLARCLACGEFIPRFYKRFLDSSDEIKQRFRFTDFERQNRMLERSLRLIAAATSGEQAGLAELHERAKTHNRDHLDIRPELYQDWLDAIVATARETDSEWSGEVAQAWRQSLGYAIRYMTRRY